MVFAKIAMQRRKPGQPQAETMRILIAEDDYISRKYLYTLLSQHGEVKLAVNGQEAVDAFALAISEKHPFDLVCLDIMMPELDGVDVLKTLRAQEAEGTSPGGPAKIVMTTALADRDHVLRAMQNGCDGYLLKPIEPVTLIKKLQELRVLPGGRSAAS